MAGSSYSFALYDILANENCSSEQLRLLKQRYAADVNSKRRLENINNLVDLLKILKKRAALDNAQLQHIMGVLKSSNNNINSTIKEKHIGIVLPLVPQTARDRAYELIMDSIGHKWIDLARALKIKEGHIDDLETCHKRIKDRVYEILLYYEYSCDQRKWKSGLLDGLKEARRSDLRNKVQDIFDTS